VKIPHSFSFARKQRLRESLIGALIASFDASDETVTDYVNHVKKSRMST
jgi:hypothetical protein